MNPQNASFVRKICYLALIVLLLGPLSCLSRPSTPRTATREGSTGGLLAWQRAREGLTPTQFGEIDPASETIRLATLGMRGIAANVLWMKCHEYKKKKDWTRLSATVRQLTKLEPNFIEVWEFQGWNLSYNVSVECDDYRDRYFWVIEGIRFLMEGIRINQREPKLVRRVGWVTSQKIGRADEHKQFRRMFKADDDFHNDLPYFAQDPTRDNWLVGKRWFRKAEQLVDEGERLRATAVVFRSDAPMCQMSYADAIEKEGTFGEKARRAWQQAAADWREFGNLPIPTAFETTIRLNDLDRGRDFQGQSDRLSRELRELAPEEYQRLRAQREALLSDAHRKALETPEAERSAEQFDLAAEAEQILTITHRQLARSITGPQREKALEMAEQADYAMEMVRIIQRYRDIVNFDYWRLRAEVEQRPETIRARQAIFEGGRAYADGDLLAARRHYDEGLAGWRKVIDRFPALLEKSVFIQDMMDVIRRYRRLYEQLGEPFPEDFILNDVIERAGPE